MDMAMHDDVASDFDPLPLSIDGYFSTVAHAERCIQELCARYHKDICDSAHLRCSRHFAELEFQQTSRPSQLTPTEESGLFRSSYGNIVGLRSGKTGESAWGGNGVSSNVSVTTGYGSEALPIRLNVQRAPNEDDNVLYEVEVFVGYLWICFPQWLQTTFMPRFSYYSADLTHKQVQTWSRNGMIFRLLDLPREIRDIIYLYTMGSTGAFRAFYSGGSSEDLVQCLPQEKKASWLTSPMMITDMASVLPPGTCKNLVPDELHFGRFSCGNYQLNRKGDNRLGVILSPLKWRASEPSGRILTLLIVSKQVRKEYICAQWKLAGKSMDASALHIPWYRVACLNLITKFQAHYSLETLNRVQLYIDHYTYVRNYFHVNNYDTDAGMVGFLAALPPIRTLEFRFAKIRQSPPSAFICYKISIDWYFTVLLGHIRHLIQGNHIDQITITGDIKHSTRAMWEEIFADEKKGVIHDMAAKMKLIWSFGIME